MELLQIASFSRGSVSTALLLLAIVVAFKSLLTSLLYCWYLYNTRLARDLAAWKQVRLLILIRVELFVDHILRSSSP